VRTYARVLEYSWAYLGVGLSIRDESTAEKPQAFFQ